MDTQYIGFRLLERGFKDWFLFFFKQIEGQAFIQEAIHTDLFNCFKDIEDLKNIRQVINIPPRSAKTTLAIYFIAYCLAKNLKCNFIYTSFSQELLSANSKRLASILNDVLYKDMYLSSFQEGEVDDTLTDDFWKDYYKINDNKFKFTAKQITTSKGGNILFNSIGSSITGFGASIRGAKGFTGALIIDDPNKPNEVHSAKIREKVKRYYEETLLSRLNNSDTPIINIQQRLHVDDLSGYLEKKCGYNVLKKPLIENDVCQLPIQYTDKRIEELKRNNYLFSSQYQQEPTQIGGNLIKTEWFKTITTMPDRFDNLFITCDTAFSTKQSADNSSFGLFGIKNNDLYLLDMFAGRIDFPTLKNSLKSFYLKAKENFKFNIISAIYIEAKASGQSLIQELKLEKMPIQPIFPTITEKDKEVQRDKYWRAQEVLSDIADGYVYIPSSAYWLTDFISEVENFTGIDDEHDDRVDVLLYALKIRRKKTNINWGESLQKIQQFR